MKRRALITGITGQDGSYAAELLLEKDYEVFGLTRRTSTTNLWRLQDCLSRIELVEGDITDETSLQRLITSIHPDEVYHFASQSHVGTSFNEPLHTMDVTGGGTLRLLEAIRLSLWSDSIRMYQASSSEQFGNAVTAPQDECTPMRPISPYGCAKIFAHRACVTYREAYGMHVACGIAYNHESPRRGETFVTRKITQHLARMVMGDTTPLRLGNVAAKRDWSHAKDMVRGAWLILQHPVPEDWVLASGEQHAVKEFLEIAYAQAGLTPSWMMDSSLFRPREVESLVGNASKAHRLLGWTPQVTFHELVKEMVDADVARLRRGDSSPSERLAESATAVTESAPTDVSEGAA